MRFALFAGAVLLAIIPAGVLSAALLASHDSMSGTGTHFGALSQGPQPPGGSASQPPKHVGPGRTPAQPGSTRLVPPRTIRVAAPGPEIQLYNAPDDIRHSLTRVVALFRGPGAPGTSVAGFPNPTAQFRSDLDHFMWVHGLTSAGVQSIAVLSPLGDQIFVGKAIGPVEQLIHRYGVVGGWGRLGVISAAEEARVGNFGRIDFGPPSAPTRGDLYSVNTNFGTAILIRLVKEQNGGEARYETLSPPVAALWLWAMQLKGQHWLYPVVRSPNRVELRDEIDGPPLAVIKISGDRAESSLDPGHARENGQMIRGADLVQLKATAR